MRPSQPVAISAAQVLSLCQIIGGYPDPVISLVSGDPYLESVPASAAGSEDNRFFDGAWRAGDWKATHCKGALRRRGRAEAAERACPNPS